MYEPGLAGPMINNNFCKFFQLSLVPRQLACMQAGMHH